jgi:hypothetical protein
MALPEYARCATLTPWLFCWSGWPPAPRPPSSPAASPGRRLTGDAVAGGYTVDTSLLSGSVSGTTYSYTGSPGAVTVTVTIDGQSYTFTDATYSVLSLDGTAGEFVLQAANYTGGLQANIRLDVFLAPGVLGDGTDPALPFAAATLDGSSGGFAFVDGDPNNPVAEAGADFTVDSLAQGAAVPEPASLALLAASLGGAIVARRRGVVQR